ncbi:MAG: acyl-CoA thioesterase [Mesorhizobium sp.]|uniref:acyl-CoA thioesterase n=1 Tax=unclassified Mesorhizobium TaxID=325217 RepID=UPI000FCB5F28|nr:MULTISPECIES: thioesterase family protein [unclassified Mesorhizobium]RUU67745.1 acyl-CoA thioesterase [Mesorhizobium sp. M7A.T.Ca.TU.009.01.1.1]RUU89941.1 acyl-CoA thioesterase [Mesorhizobium sp. M7A.T.Ca.TU.009.01.1.2]RUX01947.1 acyl-CoA thioesterase [Mesorhizobium sp. M8A.F.Ca.ET.023.01.1.1]RVD50520.1 acyl-CoA thioesterase [Mesorhizobium sp. M8A.F.Ca.ET.023.02.2.1]TGR36802.1 acyl-CoA thioesterase [bacterium M00.F.Ca.ET.199.01.1.1]TGU17596.1 acyl-CoA thioesterase [bacterium M00.F.Ca.ET.1
MNDARLLDIELFQHFADEHVRFCDTDALGHVNVGVYSSYFAAGRAIFDTMLASDDYILPIARIAMDLRAEIKYPNKIVVGSLLLQTGRSSFLVGQGLWIEGKPMATAEVTHVLVDRKNGRSTPLPEPFLHKLRSLGPVCAEG